MNALICTLSRSDGAGLGDDVRLTDKSAHYLALDELDLSQPGTITAGLWIVGADRDAMVANYRRIEAKLREAADGAAGRGEWVTLELAYRTTESVFYDVTGGTLTPGQVIVRAGRMRATLVLQCLPWARGPEQVLLTNHALANGVGTALVAGVGGDLPALTRLEVTDTSPTGVINRQRWAGAHLDDPATQGAGDFDPWVDVTAIDSATTGTDGVNGTVGASYVTKTVASRTFAGLARAVMPAGALNRGKRDIWARIHDAATALGTPSSFTHTTTAPTVNSSTTETRDFTPSGSAPAVGLMDTTYRTTTGTSHVHSYGGTVTPGSAVVMHGVCLLAETITTPASWDLLATWTTASFRHYLFARFNMPASQSNVTITVVSSTNLKAFTSVEIDNPAGTTLSAAIRQIRRIIDAADPAFSLANDTDTPDALVTILAAGDKDVTTDFWSNGVTQQRREVNTSGTTLVNVIAAKTASEPGPFATEAFDSDPVTIWNGVAIEWIRAGSWATTETTTTEYVEPTPGELLAGAYSFRLRAMDVAGRFSPAVSRAVTIATDRSKVAFTWSAPAAGDVSQYELSWTDPDGESWRIYTGDAATSFTLTTTEGAEWIAALPSSGDAAPPARLRVRGGTTGGELVQIGDEIVLPGAGAWRDVRIASARAWPPVGRMLADAEADWALELDLRSANGRDATVRIDAIWSVPHDEPQLEVAYPDLDLGTKRRWILETDRRGSDTHVRLEDTGTSAEVGAWSEPGAYLLAPGSTVAAGRFEQAGGLSDVLNATATVTLSCFPRYRWQKGNAS